jgi:hypothetical protein
MSAKERQNETKFVQNETLHFIDGNGKEEE